MDSLSSRIVVTESELNNLFSNVYGNDFPKYGNILSIIAKGSDRYEVEIAHNFDTFSTLSNLIMNGTGLLRTPTLSRMSLVWEVARRQMGGEVKGKLNQFLWLIEDTFNNLKASDVCLPLVFFFDCDRDYINDNDTIFYMDYDVDECLKFCMDFVNLTDYQDAFRFIGVNETNCSISGSLTPKDVTDEYGNTYYDNYRHFGKESLEKHFDRFLKIRDHILNHDLVRIMIPMT